MDENHLRELLIQTDAASGTPRSRDLVGGAIRRRYRRRRNAAIGAVIGAFAVVAIFTFQLMRSGGLTRHEVAWEKPVAKSVPSNEMADAIELDVATRTVDGLLRAEREQAVNQRMQRLEEERFIHRQEREVAARAALASAESLGDGAEATVLRRIVQCYSGTGAAAVAQEKLANIQ